MKLTQANIATLEIPSGKTEFIVFDEKLPGFGLRLRAGGKRTWIVQYRVGRKQRRKTLGSVDKVPAARARETAENDLANVQLGSDPQAKKTEHRVRAAETLEAMSTRFLAYQQPRLKPRSYEQIETHLTKHWAPLKGLPIHEITRRNVAARLGEIAAERGPYAANRARGTLSTFFGWAMNEGLVDSNPVIATNKQIDEQARDRVLTDAELVAIWNACRDDDYSRIVKLLILTGQRRDEVGAVAKSEISIGSRKWNIPRERTKNKLPHEVPLSDLAIGILEKAILREGREGRDLVFGEAPAREGAAERGFSGWSKAKSALDQRIEEMTHIKPAPWRIHDLRRTAATRMADLGGLPHVIEAVLNHISGHKAGVAGIYNRATYAAEKRQALDLWAAHIEAILAGKTASNVLPMKA
jgi:integrase